MSQAIDQDHAFFVAAGVPAFTLWVDSPHVGAGATSLGEPSDRRYGDRAAEIADPFGNHWSIATRVTTVP